MRKKKWFWPAVVGGCLLVAFLFFGCGGQDASPPQLNETDMGFALTGRVDYSDLIGDSAACLDVLRQSCFNNQEMLVATMTAFPQTLRDYGIDIDDPQVLDQQLDFAKDGEKLRLTLIEAMEATLTAGSISTEFGSWQGYGSALYIFVRDVADGSASQNCGLMPVPICLDGHPIMVIAHSCADGTQEVGYFDLCTGFQRILPQEAVSYDNQPSYG